MATIFTYSKHIDFPTDQVSLTVLANEINQGSAGLASNLRLIDSFNTTVQIIFFTDLTGPQEAELDAIVAGHGGMEDEPPFTIGFETEFDAGSDIMLNVLLDEDGYYTYVGESVPGTLTSQPKWRIFRIDESSTGSIELVKTFANGTTLFDKIWNNRTSYDYDP